MFCVILRGKLLLLPFHSSNAVKNAVSMLSVIARRLTATKSGIDERTITERNAAFASNMRLVNAQAKKTLKPHGIYVTTLPSFQSMILGPLINILGSKKFKKRQRGLTLSPSPTLLVMTTADHVR